MKSALLLLFVTLLTVVGYSQPFGHAIFMDGVSSNLEIPSHDSLHSSTNLTLEAWIKPCNVVGNNIIFSKIWCSGQQNSYFFSVQDGKLNWVWYSGNCGATNSVNRYKSTSAVIQTNVWQHVAVVHSPTSVKLFVNGVEVVATLQSGSYGNLRSSTEPIRVGAYKSLNGSLSLFFSGQMDELRVFNQSISDSLILSRFNGPLSGNEPSLMGYYDLDNTTVGPNQTIPNQSIVLGAAGDAITKGSSSTVTPFYLDSNTSYILGPDTVMYTPTTFNLNASIPSGSYLWQNGSSNSSFSTSTTGQFYVTYSNSCISSTDTINISLPTPNLDSGLVAYFKLDSNVADSSVTAIHGTGSNLTSVAGIQCDSNTAYDFNGTSSKIVCGTSNRGVTNTVNISAWVKTTANTGHRFIVDKYNWSVNKGYYLAIKNGVPYIGARNTSGSGTGIGYHTWVASQTFLVTDGEWHHLLGVVSNNNLEIWVDGVLKASNTMTASTPDLTTNYNLNIGYYYKGSLNSTPNYYQGTLDEIRVYNRNLSALEIEDLRTDRYRYDTISNTVCDSMVSPSGNTWYSSGVYQDTVSNNCVGDSIYTINLTVLNGPITQINETTCGNYTSPSGNYVWNSTGVYFDTLTSSLGCDSVIEVNLNISPIPLTNLAASNCYSYTSSSGNHTWYSSGVYYDTLTSSIGCDSILSISVTILPYELITLTETACNSYTSPSGNNTWTASGNYFDLVSYANGCDTLYSISLTISQNSSSSITLTHCDTYTSPSGNYTWTNSGVYSDTIPNTGGCDSAITINLTIHNSQTMIQTQTSCDSYTWASNGVTYWASGVYGDTLTNVFGCDSINTLNLTINSGDTISFIETSCNSYNWTVTGTTYTQSGNYSSLFTNQNGCDSLLQLNLTINSSSTSSINVIACDSYSSPSGNYTWTNSGVHLDTISNSVGCDSVLTINLTIHNTQTVTQTEISCDSYTWGANGTTYWASGIYSDTLTNVFGCDSINVLNLTINSGDTTNVTATSCDLYIWTVSGMTYTQSGMYSSLFTNQNGCDSLIQLMLTINGSSTSTSNITACDSYLSPSGNYTWTTSGTYQDTLTNSSGCDSILTINLTVNQSSVSSFSTNACYSYTSPSGNYTWTNSGTYLDTINNSTGCDSIITIQLTINSATSSSHNVIDCDSYTWSSNGNTYLSSGVYLDTLINSVGCDSIITLNLTINNSTSGTESVNSCWNYLWPTNGLTYTNSGLYTTTILNGVGCDSIVTLNLTIGNSTNTTQTISACDSLISPSGGSVYYSSGTYVDTMSTSLGCDSIITTNVTVNYSSTSSSSISACDSYFWPVNNMNYSVTGTYIDTINSSTGCDSVLTLYLTINTSDTITQVVSTCSNYTWPVNNSFYTTSGTYSQLFSSSNGCDSLMVLDLTILGDTAGSETVMACDSFQWVTNNATYLVSGTYTALVTNSSGCDSLATLFLTINNSSIVNISETVCDSYLAPDGVTYTSSGLYQAVLSSATGCDSIISIDLTVENINTTVTQVANVLQSVSDVSYTYQWIDCENGNQLISGAQDSVFTPTVNGGYAVIINNGFCSDTSSCISVTNVGMQNIEIEGIYIYPNPVVKVLYINTGSMSNLEIVIMDVTGKVMFHDLTNGKITEVDCSNLPTGMYFIKVGSNESFFTEKIIVR